MVGALFWPQATTRRPEAAGLCLAFSALVLSSSGLRLSAALELV
jgi:hypothetical protein